MTLQAARRVYEEIIDAVRERRAEISEQESALPAAAIRDRVDLGELMVTRHVGDDYRVIWFPTEMHVGQDSAIIESSDEASVLDVSLCGTRDAVLHIFRDV